MRHALGQIRESSIELCVVDAHLDILLVNPGKGDITGL